MRAQYLEQMIPPQVQTRVSLLVQHIVELANPDSGLTTTDRMHEAGLPLIPISSRPLPPLRLIPGLAADTQQVACPTDGQSGNAFLREVLSDRFLPRPCNPSP